MFLSTDQQNVLDAIKNAMPIAPEWTKEWTVGINKTRACCTNTFAAMDDDDNVIGTFYFSVHFDIVDGSYMKTKIYGNAAEKRLAKKLDVQDYIHDTIAEELYYTFGDGSIKEFVLG